MCVFAFAIVWSHLTNTVLLDCICRCDKDDAFQRDMERRKRRAERGGNNGAGADGGYIHEKGDRRNLEPEAKSHPLLTRNPHHGVFKVGRSSPRRSRRKRSR